MRFNGSRLLMILVGVLVVVILAGLGFYYWSNSRSHFCVSVAYISTLPCPTAGGWQETYASGTQCATGIMCPNHPELSVPDNRRVPPQQLSIPSSVEQKYRSLNSVALILCTNSSEQVHVVESQGGLYYFNGTGTPIGSYANGVSSNVPDLITFQCAVEQSSD